MYVQKYLFFHDDNIYFKILSLKNTFLQLRVFVFNAENTICILYREMNYVCILLSTEQWYKICLIF